MAPKIPNIWQSFEIIRFIHPLTTYKLSPIIRYIGLGYPYVELPETLTHMTSFDHPINHYPDRPIVLSTTVTKFTTHTHTSNIWCLPIFGLYFDQSPPTYRIALPTKYIPITFI